MVLLKWVEHYWMLHLCCGFYLVKEPNKKILAIQSRDDRKITLLLRPTCLSLFLAILIRIISIAVEDIRAGSTTPGLAT